MARKAAMMCISTAFVTKTASQMPQTLEPADTALLGAKKARKQASRPHWRLIKTIGTTVSNVDLSESEAQVKDVLKFTETTQ
jgi:hypothetical protein